MDSHNRDAEAFLRELVRPGGPLAAVLDTLFDGVYVTDRARRIVYWNRAAEAMTGFTAGEVTGRRCADNLLRHTDGAGRPLCTGACPLQRVLDEGTPVSEKVFPARPDGTRFPVQTAVSPLCAPDGTVVGAIEVFRDISEEECRRTLEEKFSGLVRRYVSSATLQGILSDLQTLHPVRQPRVIDLTVMFLDVVDFTGYAERHAPERVVAMLNSVFGVCDLLTRQANGDIEKFIGDAVMAVFPAPDAAVTAACGIIEALHELNRRAAGQGGEPVRVRLGINWGAVLQADIGTVYRKDFTVIGDTVNTASRIEQAAGVCGVEIAGAVYERLSEENKRLFAFDRTAELRGKRERIDIYRQIRPGLKEQ